VAAFLLAIPLVSVPAIIGLVSNWGQITDNPPLQPLDIWSRKLGLLLQLSVTPRKHTVHAITGFVR
jgi:hypothetical protein